MLVVTSVVAVAGVVAFVFTLGKLRQIEMRSAQAGLHLVRISCVDAISGSTLEPRLLNLPVPESGLVAEGRSGPVTVFWSGLKSEGDQIGVWSEGYDVKLLPPGWQEARDVVLQLSKSKNVENAGTGQPAIRSQSKPEGVVKPQAASEGSSR